MSQELDSGSVLAGHFIMLGDPLAYVSPSEAGPLDLYRQTIPSSKHNMKRNRRKIVGLCSDMLL